MTDRTIDHDRFPEETGASTGDARENDAGSAGFTDTDRLFRSHFQRVNRLADRSYEHARHIYQLGESAAMNPANQERDFSDVERELEHGWLSMRTGGGDWTSVRAFAEEGFRLSRAQGRIVDPTPAETSDAQERVGYADPVADGIDPTAPGKPAE